MWLIVLAPCAYSLIRLDGNTQQQQVPDSTEQIYLIGTKSNASMLYDATEAFDSHDARADELIRRLKQSENDALEEAIEKCVSLRVFPHNTT